MIQRQTRDTVLLSGWLFADLLLGLAVIFLASTNGPPPPPPPKLAIIGPKVISSTDCTNFCTATITVGETKDSLGSIAWNVSSDMLGSSTNNPIQYSPSSGTLLSNTMTTSVHISGFPCQNGSFTFIGKGGVNNVPVTPVTVYWRCTPKTIRLDTNYHRLILPNVDYNGLLTGSQSAINDVRNRVSSQIPPGVLIGFAIVYDGTPNTDNDINIADNVDGKVYQILHTLNAFQRSSYYNKDPLFTLNGDHALVQIDLFYFTTQ